MPPIQYLNPPPNPFWDFVAGVEDHPFFRFRGHPFGQPPQQPDAQPEQSTQQETPQMSEKTKGKQAQADDPPEVDPATLNKEKTNEKCRSREGKEGHCKGRGRFAAAFGEDGEPRRGPGCGGRGGWGGRGRDHHGPPPWAFGGHVGPRWGPHGGPPHRGGWGHHHRGPPPGAQGPEGFNLGEFLNNLGQRLGVDLSGAAEGLGLDRFTGPKGNNDADFEPRADVFDTPAAYIIHVSLPGAKKEDVGVDWDGENSHLRIAGVVHRPGADEQLLAQLAVDGRKRETGVFEKTIRLGTRRDPASIDITGISAKMTDGVLVVKVPKVEVEHTKRDVPISTATPSPARDAEKQATGTIDLMDNDNDMYDAAPAEKEKEATAETEKEGHHDTRSETMDYERPEQLPQYEVEEAHEDEDWEKAGSEEEGDYVKINVD